MVIKVVWLLYMFYRYKVVLYTVTLLKSLHSTQTTRILKLFVSKKSCQCGFCSFFKVKAQSMRFSFFLYIYQTELVSTGRGYKRTRNICFTVVVQSVGKTWRYSWETQEVQLGL